MVKKKHNFFIILLAIIFITFMGLYISELNGYYDYQNHNKKILTEDAMKRFEEDVAKGLDVTKEDYLIDTYKDYSNGISKTGLKISEKTSKIMQKGIKKTFGILNSLFTE